MFLWKYWQAKYGLFTCYDMAKRWGMTKYDENLIERWERPRELHKQWNLSCMSAIVHFNGLRTTTAKSIPNIKYYNSPTYKSIIKDKRAHEINIKVVKAEKYRAAKEQRKREAMDKKLKSRMESMSNGPTKPSFQAIAGKLQKDQYDAARGD